MEKPMEYTPAMPELMLRKILLEMDQGTRTPQPYNEIKLRWVEAGLRGKDLKGAIEEAADLGWIEPPDESETPTLRLSESTEIQLERPRIHK